MIIIFHRMAAHAFLSSRKIFTSNRLCPIRAFKENVPVSTRPDLDRHKAATRRA
jgi:hypothetical protein